MKDNRTEEQKAANPVEPLYKAPPPEISPHIPQSGPATRRAMEVGAMYADKIWDDQLRNKSVDFAVGFIMRVFSFIAAVIGAEQTLRIFEQVKLGLMSLEILQGAKTAQRYIDVVFTSHPGGEADACQFVKCEDEKGKSIKAGEWVTREDGLVALRIPKE